MPQFLPRILLMCLCASALLAQDSAGVPATVADVTSLTELAAKYGPFAFAIIFLAATVWLVVRALKTDVKTQGWWPWGFAGITLGTCIFFSFLGSHHWLEAAKSAQVFRGEIDGLSSYEEVFPPVPLDEVYFKTVPGQKVQDELDPPHTVVFAILKKSPFLPNDQFQIAYKKGGQKDRRILKVKYDGGETPKYGIAYDPNSDTVELRNARAQPASTGGIHAAVPSPFAAYAQAPPPRQSNNSQVAQRVASSQPAVDMGLIALLQEPRTPVGGKIDALDRLRAMDAATLKAYAGTVTVRESFALTLIELSRHSDQELASKARTTVEKSGAESVLAAQVNSPKPQVRAAAQEAVFRVNPQRAQLILKQAAPSAQTQALSAQVQSGAKQQVLVPVGSADGDRYYVGANWDAKNVKTTRCLTELFNREIPSTRSLQQEEKLMAGQSSRIVYWYTKEWALGMAEKVKGCGATASFPNPSQKK